MNQLSQTVRDPETYATTLLVLAVDRYGLEEITSWHPQTIRLQLTQDFGDIPAQNIDKLLAAITLLTSDYFWKRLGYFNELCNVLSGDDFNPTVFRPADVADLAWGITEAMLIWPPDGKSLLTEEIKHYIGKALAAEGFVTPPAILKLALNADHSDKLRENWADRPEVFAAMRKNQAEKNQQIDQLVQANLHRLLGQITSLPLANGDASQLRERLGKAMRAEAQDKKEI